MLVAQSDKGDTTELLLRTSSEYCMLYVNIQNKSMQTDCLQMTNSQKVKIYCTPQKKVCKTQNEVLLASRTKTQKEMTPLPKLRQDMPYSKARKLLLEAGWQGVNLSWQSVPQSKYSEVHTLYHDNGFREVQDCAGTGLAWCTFSFRDAYGQNLTVITEGECRQTKDVKCEKYVSSWSVQK